MFCSLVLFFSLYFQRLLAVLLPVLLTYLVNVITGILGGFGGWMRGGYGKWFDAALGPTLRIGSWVTEKIENVREPTYLVFLQVWPVVELGVLVSTSVGNWNTVTRREGWVRSGLWDPHLAWTGGGKAATAVLLQY